MAVETWPEFLAQQFSLVWFLLTLQPWVEQKAPRFQFLLPAASSWLMRLLVSVGGIEGVDSVTAAVAYELGLEVRLE